MLGLGVEVVLAVADQQQQGLPSLLLRDLILVPHVEVRLALASLQQLGPPSLLLAHTVPVHNQAWRSCTPPMEGGLTLALGHAPKHAQVPLPHSTGSSLCRSFSLNFALSYH